MTSWRKDVKKRGKTSNPASQSESSMFSATMTGSLGRAIDDIPLPPGAIGKAEIIFEDLIDDKDIEKLVEAARKRLTHANR